MAHRRQFERMRDELLDQLEWRVGDDALAALRQLVLQQEVAAAEMRRIAVIDKIGGDDLVAVRAQHVNDVAATGSHLPEVVRQPLDAQQRLDRHRRRPVAVVPALAERVASGLARHIKHGGTPTIFDCQNSKKSGEAAARSASPCQTRVCARRLYATRRRRG